MCVSERALLDPYSDLGPTGSTKLEFPAKLLWGELKGGSQCNMLNLMIQHHISR